MAMGRAASLVVFLVLLHAIRAPASPNLSQFESFMQTILEMPEELRRQHAERILEPLRSVLDGGDGDGGKRERVLLDEAWKLGLSAPPLSAGPSMAVVNMSFYRWESVSPPPVVDWRKTVAITPVMAQFVCSSCWAIAAVDSIAMMWAIANNAVADSVSPQQVCDCATKQCCQGGWPDWAFSYVLFNGGITSNANYPYLAYDSAMCLLDTSMPSTAKITGWELVPAFNRMALMQAVSMQPVVAFISASATDLATYRSFNTLNIYNGLCSTEVNHAVVVVGFNYTGPGLVGSYWILKNSWYPTWGDRGYMYLAMVPDVRGKCGILSTPAMYPVYYPSGPQPARFSSDKRGKWSIEKVDDLSSSLFASTLSLSSTSLSSSTSLTDTPTTTSTSLTDTSSFSIASVTDTSTSTSLLSGTDSSSSIKISTTACTGIINPCGAGNCYLLSGLVRCDCSVVPNMVEVIGTPTSKCVSQSPCSSSSVNPCRGGTCTDVGDGTYTCSCAAGYAIGAAVDGSPTCLPAVGSAKSYLTLPGDNCTAVATAFSISTSTLIALNGFINCSATEYLPPGVTLTVSPALSTASSFCTKSYIVRPSDTCSSLANSFFSGLLAALAANNPGMSCKRLFKSQQICLQMSSSSTPAVQCGQSVPAVTGDTCASIAGKYLITASTVASLNPGINCNAPLLVGSDVCVGQKSPATAINCTSMYRVMQGDTCPSIWNAANLTMSMFLAINPGIQCQAPFFTVGQQVCINSPILATMQAAPNASYSIYTVKPGDTLSSISMSFIYRCTAASVSTASIAVRNYMADANAPLAVGMNLIIPCIGRIGVIDCGCANSLPVCGWDLVMYPSYCDAVCNYALPLYETTGYCTGSCGVACQDRMGIAPLPGFGCTQAVCPYPTWPFSDANQCQWHQTSTDGPCCSARANICGYECQQTAATLGGTSSVRTTNYNKCYSQCMCCYTVGACGAPTCTAPSSCWSESPRRCVYSNYAYKWNCTWFPSLQTPLP